MAYPATTHLPARPAIYEPGEPEHLGLKLFAVPAGVALGALIPIAIWLAASAQGARHDAQAAAAKVASGSSMASMPGMAGMSGMSSTAAQAGTYATPSFAGIAPANADAIAMRHAAFPAELPARRQVPSRT